MRSGAERRAPQRGPGRGLDLAASACALAIGLALALAGRALAQDVPFSAPAPGRIVYTRQQADAFDMFTSDPDGSNERRLSDIDDSAAGEDQPRWSPDGRSVAFASYPKGLTSIDIVGAEGGAVRTVVEADGISGDVAWAPDGRCLVYDGGVGPSEDDQKKLDLKVWCEDGSPKGTVRRLTNTPDVDEREPDWSPDGQTIVFTARSNKPNTTDRWELWRIRPDGTGREPVVERPNSHERHPRFAPGGDRLAFITGPQPFSFGTLAVVDLASRAVERYVEGPSDTLSWSPDGTEIVFGNIFRGGVREPPPGALARHAPALAAASLGRASRAAVAAAAAGASRAAPDGARQGVQYAGLYRIQLADRTVTRLNGAAGGALAPNASTNFEFGYMPDWSPGTATPTPVATATPTASNTPLPTDTPTQEPTPTPAPPRIYLPHALRNDPEPPTPTPTPLAEASAPATPDGTATGVATEPPTALP